MAGLLGVSWGQKQASARLDVSLGWVWQGFLKGEGETDRKAWAFVHPPPACRPPTPGCAYMQRSTSLLQIRGRDCCCLEDRAPAWSQTLLPQTQGLPRLSVLLCNLVPWFRPVSWVPPRTPCTVWTWSSSTEASPGLSCSCLCTNSSGSDFHPMLDQNHFSLLVSDFLVVNSDRAF
jgi:hypothetical protein